MRSGSLANGGAVNGLVQTYDPLYTFPSYGTIGILSGFCHYINTGSGSFAPFTQSASGTGAASNWVSAAVANRFGVASLDTGTTTAGYVSHYSQPVAFWLGQGVARFRADVNIPTASDGTDTFTCRVGFNDAYITAADGVDAVFFRYTHSVNSGNWVCVTRSNSVETVTNTSVAASGAMFQCLEIEVNAAATSVDFRINGVNVATNTTNIPSGSAPRALGPGISITKSAGTTSRGISIDLMGYHLEFATGV